MLNTTRRLRPIDRLLADAWRLLACQWPVLVTAQGLVLAITLCLVLALLGPLLFWFIDYAIRHFPHLPRRVPFATAWPVLRQVLLPPLLLLMGGITVSAVVATLVKMWGHGVIFFGLAHGTSRRAPACATCLRGVARALPLFWLNLVLGCIVGGGIVWGVVPGIVLAIGLSQTLYIRVLEGVPIDAALRQSWIRTHGHRWAILGRYVLLVLCTLGLLFAVGILQMLPVVGLISLPIQVVVQFGVPVCTLVVEYLIYLDLRPRPGDGMDAATAPIGWFGFFAASAFLPLVIAIAWAIYATTRVP